MIHNFIILQRISTINKTNVNRLSVHNAFSARRVPSMEQKLLILPQHSSSSPVFCVAWCQSLDHCLFLCFTFVFCISVLLQFTASNIPFPPSIQHISNNCMSAGSTIYEYLLTFIFSSVLCNLFFGAIILRMTFRNNWTLQIIMFKMSSLRVGRCFYELQYNAINILLWATKILFIPSILSILK